MKKSILISSMLIAFCANAHNSESSNMYYETSIIKCDKEGCSVVCHEPGARWDTYLQTAGDIEVKYFYASGTKQLKAKVEGGDYTIIDTNPAFQSCRITGVSE